MAKAKTTKKDAPKTKKKPGGVKSAATKIRAKASKAGHKGYDALAKLVDHPLIADLLAVGAMAAVVAIAGDKSGNKAGVVSRTTSKAVKAAGTAAAAAIGKRLLDEFSDSKKAAKKS